MNLDRQVLEEENWLQNFSVDETLENFQFQVMNFMGVGPEGGRCRQVEKKTKFMINKIFCITHFEDSIKTDIRKSQNGRLRKETTMIGTELHIRCQF
jgi:hypothetical protein